MTTQPQPEALRLANQLRDILPAFRTPSHERGVLNGAIQRLEQLHAECEELRKSLALVQQHHATAWNRGHTMGMHANAQIARQAQEAVARYAWGNTQLTEALMAAEAECEALRADAERGRWLVDWLEQTGLVSVLFCQPDAGMRAEDWFVFWRPYGVDRTRSPEGYAKTPEGAIDAARAAKEQSK